MPEIITTKLYKDEVTIDFYPNSHRYKANGVWVPLSVTKITGIVDKSAPLMCWACKMMRDELLSLNGISPAALERAVTAFKRKQKEATSIGKMVHDFCQKFAEWKIKGGEKPGLPDNEQAVNGCLAFMKWVKESNVKFLAVEQMVYSRKYGYVGMFDVLCLIDGKLVLADYKTSKAYYAVEMRTQTAGYQIAYEEENDKGALVDRRLVLLFGKETGEFSTHWQDEHEEDKAAFLAARDLRSYQKRLEA